jgi:hypothetical protein
MMSDIQVEVALIGMGGVVAGAIFTMLGNFALEWFRTRGSRKLAAEREKLLKNMLNHPIYSWRQIKTLAAVIGCDEEQTKEHLIAIGARGSEKDDGKWGLLSRHPLNEING